MAMHTRYSEAIQGTETKSCSYPPAEQLNPHLEARGARGVLQAALPTGGAMDPPRKGSCVSPAPLAGAS